MIESDIDAPGGRRIHLYDSGRVGGSGVIYWQHGAGMSGLPPLPFVHRARDLGIRVVSHDRPGYGRSAPQSGRSVADGARDATSVLDALEIESAATLGLSAGAMHALAAVAVNPLRFTAAAVLGGPAPYGAVGLDWFAGMSAANRAEFEAGLAGAEPLRSHLSATTEVDLGMFAAADLEAMHGPYWQWQLDAAAATSTEGTIDDELACLADWRFRLDQITAPVLIMHGADDTFVPATHARWVAGAIPTSTLRIEPGGHISTIPLVEESLPWLLASGPRLGLSRR
ncbi:alpha/beta fold hydrolase [Gryllotalpicola protaetiae]|uniref:Alpha/beta hydrolase n=1 Tax=Gryllotalpicola protaetiae TaxID=2419771 RepID=A0A387BPM3_9MICO|nr:alpha/beta hydrolase [Gryllotalpicola protaetiae]AYG04668.1 alpha/beta hydrolase [Gryllotalpicola protaetiae]